MILTSGGPHSNNNTKMFVCTESQRLGVIFHLAAEQIDACWQSAYCGEHTHISMEFLTIVQLSCVCASL